MSARRGVEIHNGYALLGDGQGVQLGTETLPITQGVAGQIVVEAVINAIALGGDVKAGHFRVNASVNLTGSPSAILAVIEVNAGITVTGNIRSGYFQANVLAGAVMVGRLDNLYVTMYSAAGATLDNVYGIHISNYMLSQPNTYYHMRLTENGTVTVTAAFYLTAGGTSDMTNLFLLAGGCTAWSATLNPPGAGPPAGGSGRIALDVGGLQRYLQLFV